MDCICSHCVFFGAALLSSQDTSYCGALSFGKDRCSVFTHNTQAHSAAAHDVRLRQMTAAKNRMNIVFLIMAIPFLIKHKILLKPLHARLHTYCPMTVEDGRPSKMLRRT